MLKTFSRDVNSLKQSLLRASSSYHMYPLTFIFMDGNIIIFD